MFFFKADALRLPAGTTYSSIEIRIPGPESGMSRTQLGTLMAPTFTRMSQTRRLVKLILPVSESEYKTRMPGL